MMQFMSFCASEMGDQPGGREVLLDLWRCACARSLVARSLVARSLVACSLARSLARSLVARSLARSLRGRDSSRGAGTPLNSACAGSMACWQHAGSALSLTRPLPWKGSPPHRGIRSALAPPLPYLYPPQTLIYRMNAPLATHSPQPDAPLDVLPRGREAARLLL